MFHVHLVLCPASVESAVFPGALGSLSAAYLEIKAWLLGVLTQLLIHPHLIKGH